MSSFTQRVCSPRACSARGSPMFGSFLARSAGQPILGDGAAATPEARQAAAGGRESVFMIYLSVVAALGAATRAIAGEGGVRVGVAWIGTCFACLCVHACKQMVLSTSQVLADITIVSQSSLVDGLGRWPLWACAGPPECMVDGPSTSQHKNRHSRTHGCNQ